MDSVNLNTEVLFNISHDSGLSSIENISREKQTERKAKDVNHGEIKEIFLTEDQSLFKQEHSKDRNLKKYMGPSKTK